MRLSTLRFCMLMLLGGLYAYAPAQQIQLSVLGSYQSGVFDEGAAEITAYDPQGQQLFVTNADQNTLDVLDLSDPTQPTLAYTIDLSVYGGGPNSVAVFYNIVAVAVEADTKTDPGSVVFFDRNGVFQNQLTVGALPDMLTFTPNGKYLLVANEGEPDDDYIVDPEGSISIIEIKRPISSMTQAQVKTADFTTYNSGAFSSEIRVFGPGATPAQDFEPEYIAVDATSKVAWVTLQEANAVAKVSIPRAKVRQLFALGFKDHMLAANKLDASNRDDAINITNWPVHGMYQPDAIAYFRVNGQDYLITANEGDSRDYDGFSEEARVKDLTLDPMAFPNASELQENENLGRLLVTTTQGDTDGDGDFDELYNFGGRSFSIWDGAGNLVFDSGDELEQLTAAFLPDDFNSTNSENDSFDGRSDDKGPEPEGVVTGEINGVPYAFIGLERIGGVMVYDLSDPASPVFVQYINNRDFSGDAEAGTALDLGPEGLIFINGTDSPNGMPMVVVANEISGSVTTYSISVPASNSRQMASELDVNVNLGQNYPNPFSYRTIVPLTLNEAMPVRLSIYNLNGQRVRSLLDQNMKAGSHEMEWDGTDEQGQLLPEGVYFYRLEAGHNLIVRKMVISR